MNTIMSMIPFFRRREAAAMAKRILREGDTDWGVIWLDNGKYLVAPKDPTQGGCVVLQERHGRTDLAAKIFDHVPATEVLRCDDDYDDFGFIAHDNVCLLLEELRRMNSEVRCA